MGRWDVDVDGMDDRINFVVVVVIIVIVIVIFTIVIISRCCW